MRAAVVPLLPGRAADTYLPGPGAGSPGLQDASEAADGGAERPEGAEAETGGPASQGHHGAPPLGPKGRALPLPAQRGSETGGTGSSYGYFDEPRETQPRPAAVDLFFVVLQATQSKQEQLQEEAAERRLRKASKEVLQMRGQSQKEPLPVQTFRLEFSQLSHCYPLGVFQGNGH